MNPAGRVTIAGEERVLQVARDTIVPNPRQPRRRFSAEHINRLARSIESQGVIQPLVVRLHPSRKGHYELVAGERRLRAVASLDWTDVPVIVRDIPDGQLLETALVENLQREELTPIEEAHAYRTLMEAHGYTQQTLAGRVGRERSTIANLLRLLALPPALQTDLEEERLTIGHARALLPLDDAALQIGLRDLIVERDLSVREVERRVRRFSRSGGLRKSTEETHPAGSGAGHGNPKFAAVQEKLENRFHTRVRLAHGPNNQGRIEIEYYSLEDFNRIYDLLLSDKG